MWFFLINSIIYAGTASGGTADCPTNHSVTVSEASKQAAIRAAKTICGTSRDNLKYPKGFFESVFEGWKKTTASKPPSKSKPFDEYVERYASLEAMLYEALAVTDSRATKAPKTQHLTPETLVERANLIRTELSELIRAEATIPETTKTKMLESLSQSQVLTLATIRNIENDYDREAASNTYRRACGTNLSEPVAITHNRTPSGVRSQIEVMIVICPMALTRMARGASQILGIERTLAHELAHAATINMRMSSGEEANRNYEAKFLPRLSFQAHEPYLSCIKNNHENTLISLESLKQESENILNSDDDAASFKAVGRLESIERLEQLVPFSPSQVESHSRELIADFWANRWIAKKLKEARPKSIQEHLHGYFSSFCSRLDTSESGEDGEHPSDIFRINEAVRTPEIRNLIKKSNLNIPINGVSCDLEKATSNSSVKD